MKVLVKIEELVWAVAELNKGSVPFSPTNVARSPKAGKQSVEASMPYLLQAIASTTHGICAAPPSKLQQLGAIHGYFEQHFQQDFSLVARSKRSGSTYSNGDCHA